MILLLIFVLELISNLIATLEVIHLTELDAKRTAVFTLANSGLGLLLTVSILKSLIDSVPIWQLAIPVITGDLIGTTIGILIRKRHL